MIAPAWLAETGVRKVLEGLFTSDQIKEHNNAGYNIYFLPNGTSNYEGGAADGTHIDLWDYIFVDYDLKSGTYADKDAFIGAVIANAPPPTRIVDSGNGIHVYWSVADLEPQSYLRLTSRLVRLLNTDPATRSIFQLMRLPDTLNTKNKNKFLPCEVLYDSRTTYTCEELDKCLPKITTEDAAFCTQHYDRTYNLDRNNVQIDDKLPAKFGKLLLDSHEAKSIWAGGAEDRSKDDYRLGHIMFANDFTKEEAASVLVNSAKALTRAPVHRVNYAQNIIDKIWTFEVAPKTGQLSDSVEAILKRSGNALKGTAFRCNKKIDNTAHGFRLGQVLGLVAGSGVGKTAYALNMFRWFAQENPDYHHFFIPLEQPANEIADRWQTMCGANTSLHSKVHVLSNYDAAGNFRHLSFNEIETYLLQWQADTGNKIGCVVIDHIGALKKKGANDEKQDLITICHSMKAFAVRTNTFLVMQSQSTREKSGIGDLELNKDAAYGTIFFEAYCDYLVTLWQPLKRCHAEPACPTVTAFKFCKIRHKKPRKDVIQEDVPYLFYFDSEMELMRDMTQDELTSFSYFLTKATNKRGRDRNTDIVEYKTVDHKEIPNVQNTQKTH